jgi:hypothetical protein
MTNNKYTVATFNIKSFLLYIYHKHISPLSIINLMNRTVSNIRNQLCLKPPKMEVTMCSYGRHDKKSSNNSESNLHLIECFRYVNLWRHKVSYDKTNSSLSTQGKNINTGRLFVDGVKSVTKNQIVTDHIYVEIKSSMEMKSAVIATDNFVCCNTIYILYLQPFLGVRFIKTFMLVIIGCQLRAKWWYPILPFQCWTQGIVGIRRKLNVKRYCLILRVFNATISAIESMYVLEQMWKWTGPRKVWGYVFISFVVL